MCPPSPLKVNSFFIIIRDKIWNLEIENHYNQKKLFIYGHVLPWRLTGGIEEFFQRYPDKIEGFKIPQRVIQDNNKTQTKVPVYRQSQPKEHICDIYWNDHSQSRLNRLILRNL